MHVLAGQLSLSGFLHLDTFSFLIIGRTEKGKTCVQSLAKNDAALLLASQIKKASVGIHPSPPLISRIRKGLISFIEEIPNFLSALEKMYGLSARFPIYHQKRGKDNCVSF